MMDHILSAIIGFAVAFLVGLLLWIIKRERLLLEYDSAESDIFPRNDDFGKYYILNLKNKGNKAVENITFTINIYQGIIDSLQFSKPDLIAIEEKTETRIVGIIAILNPKEELRTTITINNAQNSSAVSIEARGRGVTAKKATKDPIFVTIFPILAIAAMGIVLGIFLLLMQNTENKLKAKIETTTTTEIENDVKDKVSNKLDVYLQQRQKEELLRQERELKHNQGQPDAQEIVFAILNKSGLSKKMPELLSITGEGMPIWKTGLFLMHSYLVDKENASCYLMAINELIKIDNISPSSKGLLLYLAGKIEMNEGNQSKALKYFNECMKETPLMYEHLMAQDPTYNLKEIQDLLNKSKTNDK